MDQNDNDVDLRAPHFKPGMALGARDLQGIEWYIDAWVLWILRYCMDTYGVIGRAFADETPASGRDTYDPVVSVDDVGGEEITVSVSRCRGLSAARDIVDISPSQPVSRSFPKCELDGKPDVGVYLVCMPGEKIVENIPEDSNPSSTRALRRRRYRLELELLGSDVPHSLLLGRLRKHVQTGLYETQPGFIPYCAHMTSHSELMRAWESANTDIVDLTERYIVLQEAVIECIGMANRHDREAPDLHDTRQFIERMVVLLNQCAGELVRPFQTPQGFFQLVQRMTHSASIYLALSPATKGYFRDLVEVGETELGSPLPRQSPATPMNRELAIHDDLRAYVQQAMHSMARLKRLQQALEARFSDFRASLLLETLNFFFDRETFPLAFYQKVGAASPTRDDGQLTFDFEVLESERPGALRLILIGTRKTPLAVGESLRAAVRLNGKTDRPNRPQSLTATCEKSQQQNYPMDFQVPSEILAVSDVQVTVDPGSPIDTCLLYIRRPFPRRLFPLEAEA